MEQQICSLRQPSGCGVTVWARLIYESRIFLCKEIVSLFLFFLLGQN